MDLGDVRREYERGTLRRSELQDDPVAQFEAWYRDAEQAGVPEVNAVALATVDAGGRPTVRTVLVKYFDADGFVFFTNTCSRKASDIAVNPEVCLLFFWQPLERQVVIRGAAERVSRTETLQYFMRRPHGSQLGAWVSRQSSVISSRQILSAQLDKMRRKFAEGSVPMPDFWSGYRVRPRDMEFWQGGRDRLHDRFLYSRSGHGWTIDRLAP
jgi:pyridoxamine 5'-phosphate oxidase